MSSTVQEPHKTPEEERSQGPVRERGRQLHTHSVWLPVFAVLVFSIGALHILSSIEL